MRIPYTTRFQIDGISTDSITQPQLHLRLPCRNSLQIYGESPKGPRPPVRHVTTLRLREGDLGAPRISWAPYRHGQNPIGAPQGGLESRVLYCRVSLGVLCSTVGIRGRRKYGVIFLRSTVYLPLNVRSSNDIQKLPPHYPDGTPRGFKTRRGRESSAFLQIFPRPRYCIHHAYPSRGSGTTGLFSLRYESRERAH